MKSHLREVQNRCNALEDKICFVSGLHDVALAQALTSGVRKPGGKGKRELMDPFFLGLEEVKSQEELEQSSAYSNWVALTKSAPNKSKKTVFPSYCGIGRGGLWSPGADEITTGSFLDEEGTWPSADDAVTVPDGDGLSLRKRRRGTPPPSTKQKRGRTTQQGAQAATTPKKSETATAINNLSAAIIASKPSAQPQVCEVDPAETRPCLTPTSDVLLLCG